MTVVCSGCKSILDMGATLEVLETYGVPVVGFRTDVLPAFYSRDSDHRLEHRADSPGQVARIVRQQRLLGIGSGLVVANPVPEAEALSRSEIGDVIEAAVAEADASGLRGKDVTPFLLARVVELAGPRALAADMARVRDNARVAAEIAQEI